MIIRPYDFRVGNFYELNRLTELKILIDFKIARK